MLAGDTGAVSPRPLPAEALALLPDATESMRCAAFAESIQLDPGGTAICADAVVLVETPLPWPKPVFAHSSLDGLTSMMDTAMGPARVLAAVPANDNDLRVIVYRRTPTGAVATVHRPDDPVAFVQSLASVAPEELPHEPGSDSAVLICTQGSHDICCGADGVQLAASAEDRLDAPVFRVSHTGGHRFAPTAMTFPDGRMWAYLSLEDLTGIIARTHPGDIGERCRGWWGASTGPAQIAERAIFAQEGPSFDTRVRDVAVDETDSGWSCNVSDGQKSWSVQVEPGRAIPTIACREPGGLPAKPAREFIVTTVKPTSE